MSTITVNIDPKLKSAAQKKVQKDGLTLTILISQFFKAYVNDEWVFTLSPCLKSKQRALDVALRESDKDIKRQRVIAGKKLKDLIL